ncbi:hypothetical protein [Glycomyces sp. NPDC047010]|uniref:hypothetical protein n=1 Tax=Glycomyces sp. NPDC047010 TaxID=3155023 RepID=UPI0033EDB061
MDRQRRLLRVAAAVLAVGLVLIAVPAQAQDAAATAYTIEVQDVSGLEPGGSAPATFSFVNTGTEAPEHGLLVQFVSERVVTTGEYTNVSLAIDFLIADDAVSNDGATGGSLAAIGLAGAGTLAAGALLLAFLRRRTLRNL